MAVAILLHVEAGPPQPPTGLWSQHSRMTTKGQVREHPYSASSARRLVIRWQSVGFETNSSRRLHTRTRLHHRGSLQRKGKLNLLFVFRVKRLDTNLQIVPNIEIGGGRNQMGLGEYSYPASPLNSLNRTRS